MNKPQKPCTVKLLVVIVDRSRAEKVVRILRDSHIRFHFICLGEGTAGSEFISLLGLDSIDKSIIFCLEPQFRVSSTLASISETLQLRKPGKGIAFVAPLSGLSNSILQIILRDCEIERKEDDDELENVKYVSKYDMIIAVVNPGYVDKVMEAARTAGARGGTVLHGRKIDVGEDGKFFGVAAQLEKEIVAILTTAEQKHEIMSAITRSFGLSSDARGMIFSIPVDDIEGLGSVKPME